MFLYKFLLLLFFFSYTFSHGDMIHTGTLSTHINESDYKCLSLIKGDFKFCYKFEEDLIDIYINANCTGYVGLG